MIIAFPYLHFKIDAKAEKELLTNNATMLHNRNALSLINLCNQYLEIITCQENTSVDVKKNTHKNWSEGGFFSSILSCSLKPEIRQNFLWQFRYVWQLSLVPSNYAMSFYAPSSCCHATTTNKNLLNTSCYITFHSLSFPQRHRHTHSRQFRLPSSRNQITVKKYEFEQGFKIKYLVKVCNNSLF